MSHLTQQEKNSLNAARNRLVRANKLAKELAIFGECLSREELLDAFTTLDHLRYEPIPIARQNVRCGLVESFSLHQLELSQKLAQLSAQFGLTARVY